jgi:hypothetical protein
MQNNLSKTTQVFLGAITVLLIIIVFLLLRKNNNSNITPTPYISDSFESIETETKTKPTTNNQSGEATQQATSSANVSLYKSHGFEMELPKGFVPQEYKGETGPTISIELPNSIGWLIYVTDANWWEANNLVGQADFIRDQKIGTTTFKVYKYIGQDQEFYWFKQGNVAYMFNGDFNKISEYMKTFKFVGWN